jgi:hypothetical protein
MKFIPSCDDLARSVSDGSYEGPLFDRVRLRLHMLACYFCRRYAAQVRWIDRAAKALWAEPPSGMDDFKRRLIGRLKN